ILARRYGCLIGAPMDHREMAAKDTAGQGRPAVAGKNACATLQPFARLTTNVTSSFDDAPGFTASRRRHFEKVK
ncbi:MAG TPA: hypothetical protein VNN25_16970, partial [Thermoanaerobaculia bacterium]|nr:hypothetical protein [Thermoanaerobaculia bacterium]